jgi:hypothetical protein
MARGKMMRGRGPAINGSRIGNPWLKLRSALRQ